jgi:hypothetical protein
VHQNGNLHAQAFKVKVISGKGRQNPHNTQIGNQEMVTVIKCIVEDGTVIAPNNIEKEGKRRLGWHAGGEENEQATFASPSTGRTDCVFILEWVEQNVEKYTIVMLVPFN